MQGPTTGSKSVENPAVLLGSMPLLSMSSGIRTAASAVSIPISTDATLTNFDDWKRSMKPDIREDPFPDITSDTTPDEKGMLAVRRVRSAANILLSKMFFVKKPSSSVDTVPSVGLRVIMKGPRAKYPSAADAATKGVAGSLDVVEEPGRSKAAKDKGATAKKFHIMNQR